MNLWVVRGVTAAVLAALACGAPLALSAHPGPTAATAKKCKKKKKRCKKKKPPVGPTSPSPPTPPQPQVIITSGTIPVMVNEGSTAQFQVHLQNAPNSSISVSVASGDPAVASGTSPVNFTPANYNVDQPVTVSGINDQDLANDSTTLTLSAPGAPNVNVTVNVTEDDVQQIVPSTTMMNVLEGGVSQPLQVHLAFEPPMSQNVTAQSNNTAKMLVSPAFLSFTPLNYATNQQFNVSGVQDADTVNEVTTVTLMTSTATNVVVTVNVNDDD